MSSATWVMAPPVASISARYRSVAIVIVFAGVPLAAPAPEGGGVDPAGAAGGADVGAGGKSVAAVVLDGADDGADTGGGGGLDSFCHASHSRSAENEKTTNRMRRWVSMTAWVTAPGSGRRGK